MLSHRYGTVCLPSRILETEFIELKNEIEKEFDLTFSYNYNGSLIEFKNILADCYELDKNEQPARYKLKHLNRLFPNINQKVRQFYLYYFNNL